MTKDIQGRYEVGMAEALVGENDWHFVTIRPKTAPADSVTAGASLLASTGYQLGHRLFLHDGQHASMGGAY